MQRLHAGNRSLSIELADAAGLSTAQYLVTAHHYLQRPVDPRCRPLAYLVRLHHPSIFETPLLPGGLIAGCLISSEADWQEAQAFGERLTTEGDMLLYRSRKKGQTGSMAAGLIRALAAAAFVPGGVTFAGLHFDAGIADAAGEVHCVSPQWLAPHLQRVRP